VEKQKVETPKLRATLDAPGLLADGRFLRDTKLATEFLAFAGHLEGKLAIDMARKSAADKDTERGPTTSAAAPTDPACLCSHAILVRILFICFS